MSDIKDRLIEAMQREIPYVCERKWALLETLCESPIEIALGAALLISMQLASGNAMCIRAQADEEKHTDKHELLLFPQYVWRTYRIDWVLKMARLRQPYIFIECDGHDFHERTPDQAIRDRSRDRAVQEADIPILRFTGREIYRDVQACTLQITNVCGTLLDRHE